MDMGQGVFFFLLLEASADLGCNIMALHLSTAAAGVKTGGRLELFKA